MGLAQALLFYLHAHLDSMMVPKGRIILDYEAFRSGHRLYLWTHTFQWGAGLIFIFLMLAPGNGKLRATGRGCGEPETIVPKPGRAGDYRPRLALVRQQCPTVEVNAVLMQP